MNKYKESLINKKRLSYGSLSDIYIFKLSDKELILKESYKCYYNNEHLILNELDHDYIINIIDYFCYKDKIYIIEEYFKSKNLKNNININSNNILDIFKKIVSTIQYIHSKKIIHFDISQSNILYDHINDNLKIIDFGNSFSINDKKQFKPENMFGWWQNIAPITLKTGKVGYFNDIWALGILLYTTTYNREPFRRRNSNINDIYFNDKYSNINKIIKYILNNYLSLDIIHLIIFLE